MPAVTEACAFAAALPARGALLGLDVSERRIGVAATDPERRLVTPLATLTRRGKERDLARIGEFVRARGAVGLVVGHPLSMDGSEGAQASQARAFADMLAGVFGQPVLLQDERLTSFAVAEALREGRIRLPRRGPRHLDHYAAAVILEDALRALKALPDQTPR